MKIKKKDRYVCVYLLHTYMIYGYINIYYKYGKEDNLQIALQKCEQIYNHSFSGKVTQHLIISLPTATQIVLTLT